MALEARVGAGGGGEEDGRETVARGLCEVLARFFDDHVGDEGRISPGGRSLFAKAAQPKANDGVEVAEEQQASCRAGGAQLARKADHVQQRRSAGDGAFGRALDHGAVGERVGEGHAELEHVRAVVDGGEGDVAGGGEVGVARGDKGDEAGFVREPYGHRSKLIHSPDLSKSPVRGEACHRGFSERCCCLLPSAS